MSVRPDGLQDRVTRAHIARRLQVSRGQAADAVEAPGFPAPLGRVGPSRVWRRPEVGRRAEGATALEAAESALEWLQTHH